MAGIVVQKDNIKVYLKDTTAESPVWEKVGHVAEVGDLGGDGAEDIDVTDFESEAKEYEGGLEDNGELSLTINVTDKETVDKIEGFRKAKANVEIAVTIENKAGEVVVTRHCEKGYVKTAKITGLSVGGKIQLAVGYRTSADFDTEFTPPAEA